jgi:hypothetical protein
MSRTTFTVDSSERIVRICSDKEVEVYIVDPNIPSDRVYYWRPPRLGPLVRYSSAATSRTAESMS